MPPPENDTPIKNGDFVLIDLWAKLDKPRAVYSDLWEEPPTDTSLEGWVRARCFNLGAGYLRQRHLQAPSPSLARYTSGIDADGHGGNDTLEQMISELTEQQQAALVRAHDQGVRTSEQDDPDAGWSLLHAMLALASPLTDDERHAAEMCSSGVALANWTFGLLPPHEATLVPGTPAEPTPCGRLAGVLGRARRRFEPLPPTPDLAWLRDLGVDTVDDETFNARCDQDREQRRLLRAFVDADGWSWDDVGDDHAADREPSGTGGREQ